MAGFIYGYGVTTNIRCWRTDAGISDASNLVTITRTYTNGYFKGRPASIEHPDGTMEIYEYQTQIPPTTVTSGLVYNMTNIVWRGEPFDEKRGITNGTKTVTITGPAGEPISQTTSAIQQGAPTVISQQTYGDYDAYGRPQSETDLDGKVTYTSYCDSCGCGPSSQTQPDGSTTEYAYDALKRLTTTTYDGITMSNVFDAAGNVLQTLRLGRDGTKITNSISTYDTNGFRLTSKDALGNQTSYSETGVPITRTTTYPNTGTRIESYARDGTLLKVTGTAAQGVRYTNALIQEGGAAALYTAEIKLDASGNDTSECTTNFLDFLGRTYKTGCADGAAYFHYHKSQLTNQVDPDGVSTFYFYNGKGEQEYVIVDMDSNGANTNDLSGVDRVTRTVTDVVSSSSFGGPARRTRTYVWATSSDTPTLASTVEVSLEGRTNWTTRYGLTSKVETVFLGSGSRVVTARSAIS